MKIINFIRNYAGEIFVSSLLSLCYLSAVNFTAILLSNLSNGIFQFLFSIFVYALETLLYLTALLSLF